MKRLLIGLSATFLFSSCCSVLKCNQNIGENSVFEKDSCNVRIRNVYVADQISSEFSSKLRSNPNLTIEWIPTVATGVKVIPGHPAMSVKSEEVTK